MSYFAKHWNGELSLPKAYWLGLLVCCVAQWTVGLATIDTLRMLGAGNTVVTVGLLVTMLPIYAWWVVGAWASAEKRGGGWSVAARVVISVGVLMTLIQIPEMFHQ